LQRPTAYPTVIIQTESKRIRFGGGKERLFSNREHSVSIWVVLREEPLIGVSNFGESVESSLEKVSLSVTHRVIFSVHEGFYFLPV